MFRSFVYLDEEKMYSYLRQIDKNFLTRPKESSIKKIKGAGISGSKINISSETEIEEKREINTDIFNDYDIFESALADLDGTEYFDFVLNTEYDINNVPDMCIIRINGRFEIPDKFDIFSMAPKYMPYIIGQIKTDDSDKKKLMEAFFENASADIPVLIEDEEITIAGKLRTKYLREEYTDLEDYNEQEVYILCRVIGKMKNDMVEIFNPLKDFVKLPRAVRRMEKFPKEGLESISVPGPVLKVEIIGIYK